MNNENQQEKRNQPITETEILISKDGKYIIHKTIITDIKPYAYYKKIMESSVDKQKTNLENDEYNRDEKVIEDNFKEVN